MRDLVVAGGGPLGLATALYAARAGLDVVVREPRPGVIDKACGEGLMPAAVAELLSLGVSIEGHPIDGIRYVDASGVAEARFRNGPGRGVARTDLHRALKEAVSRAGITVEHRPVVTVEQRDDRVLVDGEPTGHLVAADGLHSPVRRQMGLEARSRLARRFGQRCHVATRPWTRFVEVHWSEAGEAYVTPVGDDRVGVAVLSSQRRPFRELLDTFPTLGPRLEGLPLSRVRGAGPLRQRSRRRVAGRVLLVGDAAGYVDALTGEGIALGLAQARAAVAAVAAGDPGRYERDWRRVTWRHDLLTHGLLAVTRHRPVRTRIVPAAVAVPGVFEAAVNQLAKPASTCRDPQREPEGKRKKVETLVEEQVVLLDEDGRSIGAAAKRGVHHTKTPLHLAFSCYVFDPDGALLVTRRAVDKPTWPGVWTNSFCGHPGPGEQLTEAVRRRAEQELGIVVEDLRVALPAFRYRAVMADGVVENEMCPVFVASTRSDVRPDPEEVEAYEWVDWSEFRRTVLDGSRDVSPWCVEQVQALPQDPVHAAGQGDEALPPAARP